MTNLQKSIGFAGFHFFLAALFFIEQLKKWMHWHWKIYVDVKRSGLGAHLASGNVMSCGSCFGTMLVPCYRHFGPVGPIFRQSWAYVGPTADLADVATFSKSWRTHDSCLPPCNLKLNSYCMLLQLLTIKCAHNALAPSVQADLCNSPRQLCLQATPSSCQAVGV